MPSASYVTVAKIGAGYQQDVKLQINLIRQQIQLICGLQHDLAITGTAQQIRW